jgi:hypothetical protein
MSQAQPTLQGQSQLPCSNRNKQVLLDGGSMPFPAVLDCFGPATLVARVSGVPVERFICAAVIGRVATKLMPL